MTASRHFAARIAIAALAGMVVSSPAVFSVNPLLLTAMAGEFGWGRATLSAGYVVAAPVMALMYLVIGPLYDRFGVRRILIPGVIVFSLSTLLLAQLTGSVLQFLLIKGWVAACGSLITGIAFGKVVARHFTANRGLMLGLCLGGGTGVGMGMMPLIGAAVFAEHGWRVTYIVVSAVSLLIGLPAALALPQDSPARAATEPVKNAAEGMRAVDALRSRPFLLLVSTAFFACAAINGTQAHLAAIMTDIGLSSKVAAVSLSIYAASLMCGQFAIGWILDRVASPRIVIPVFALVLAGLLLIHLSRDAALLYAGTVLIGLGAGSEFGLLPYMLPRFFGLRAFATLYAIIYASAALATGAGPYLLGLVFDMTKSYGTAFIFFEGIVVIVAALCFLLPNYTYGVDGTPIPAKKSNTHPGVSADTDLDALAAPLGKK